MRVSGGIEDIHQRIVSRGCAFNTYRHTVFFGPQGAFKIL